MKTVTVFEAELQAYRAAIASLCIALLSARKKEQTSPEHEAMLDETYNVGVEVLAASVADHPEVKDQVTEALLAITAKTAGTS